MPNLNNEGFAIAPQSECVDGHKPVFWSDDNNTDGHALRSGHAELHRPAQGADDHVRPACGDHVRQCPGGAGRVLDEHASGQLHRVRAVLGQR